MMAREEYIRIYRSNIPGAAPSLTSGEIAANLVDGKLFVGATNSDGSLRNVIFNDAKTSVAGIAVGASSFTGTVSITNGSNVTISAASNRITISSSFSVGATGNTLVSGIAAGVSSIAGNIIAINNLGVTSFNGATGAINYYPPFATNSVTGVASFNNTDFGVATGIVSLKNAVQNIAVGASSFTGTVSITNGSNVTISAASNRITISSSFSVGATGNTLVSGIAAGVSSIAGNTIAINNLGVTSFNGLTGTVNYYPPFATSSVTGVASFNSTDFGVATGVVSLKNAVQNIAVGASSFTGAVSITNGSNVTISAASNRITISSSFSVGATGNTLVSGIAAGVSSIAGNTIAINNLGVTSFNGLTGTVNYYPPFATNSVTGVAAFDSKDFGVVSGVVSSRGVTGISAGNTGIAIDGATGEVVVTNMGVLSFNGSTGHVSVSIGQTVTGDGGALIGANNSLITARLSTDSLTGVASFFPSHFTVGSTGHVRSNIATDSAPGIASFSNLDFDISAPGGLVTIKAGGVGNTQLANSGFTLRDDSEQTSTVSLGDTLAITGGTGVVFRKTAEDNYVIYSNFTINNAPPNGNNFTVETDGKLSIPIATSSVTGVASFPSSYFSVAADGAVGILNPQITFIDATGSFVDVKTLGYGAGWTSLTLTAGSGIHVRLSPAVNPPGNALPVYTIFNTGVTSFNGSTGAINYYPPFATNSVTGVASFPLADFNVSNTGQVSLTGTVARTNTSNSWGANQDFGIYFISASAIQSPNIYTIVGDGAVAPGVITVGDITNRYPYASGIRLAVTPADENYLYLTIKGSTAMTEDRVIESPNDSGIIALTKTTVSSFNGLTGNVTLTGDGGALQGVAGTAITARLATDSLTGVASFPPTFFSIANGAVSLSGGIGFRDSFNATDVVNYNETFTLTGFGSNGIRVESAGNNTFRFTNLGVTSFNGQAGAVNYYPPFATSSVTGVASFNSTDFGVATGVVSLKNAVQNIAVGASSFTGAVSITNGSNVTISTANNRITISSSSSVGATGDTVGATGALTANTVSGVRLLDVRLATTSATGVASFNSSNFTVSNGAVALKGAVTSLNGLTGARTLTGDGGAIQGANSNAITARPSSYTLTGVAYFDENAFLVNANGFVQLAAQCPNPPCSGPVGFTDSGIGASAQPNGALAYLYFDAGNLTSYAGNFTSKTDNFVVFFDSDETGLVKTKKTSLKTFFLNNLDTLLESKTTSQFTRTKGGDSIEFATVLGAVQAGEQGLVKGASAHDYITKNTVASVDGCTGPIEITGTVNEVTVTTSCPTITVGLPDHIVLTSIAATGATFTGNLKVNGTLGLENGQTITSAVTTFNGLSGSVSYYPGIASISATGVASFSSTNFDVSGTGVVTIKSSGVPNAALANSSFTLRDEVGSTDTISLGDTLTITGGRGVDFIRTTTDTYEVRGVTATSSVLGVASFNSADFTIASGAVSLTNAARTNAANTFTGLQTFSGGITTTDGFFSFGLTFADNLRSFNPQYFDLSSDRFTLLNVGGSLIQFGMTSAAGIIINNDGEATVTLIGDIIGATGATFGGTVTATRFRGTVSGGSF